MACRLDTNPLSEPMLEYFWLVHGEKEKHPVVSVIDMQMFSFNETFWGVLIHGSLASTDGFESSKVFI